MLLCSSKVRNLNELAHQRFVGFFVVAVSLFLFLFSIYAKSAVYPPAHSGNLLPSGDSEILWLCLIKMEFRLLQVEREERRIMQGISIA